MKREFNKRNCRRQGAKRLNVRTQGGNWQGMPYLSYAEHDRCMRHVLSVPEHLRNKQFAYDQMRKHIIATRR